MGNIFTLTDTLKSTIQAALDDLITELDKTCRLYFPPKQVVCNNCILDPTSGKSSNYYLSGGPMEFPRGSICPVCHGSGRFKYEQATEDVNLLCTVDQHKFERPIRNLKLDWPTGAIQTKGFLTDALKIARCDYMHYQPNTSGYSTLKYKLASPIMDSSNIIQNRYFVCVWELI